MQSTNEKEKPIEQLIGVVESTLLSKGVYYADSLYKFYRPSQYKMALQAVTKNDTNSFRWVVLGREHYYETSKEFPIASRRDLKKALEFEDSNAPFDGITLKYIERINEQSHRVTFWVFKHNVLDIFEVQPWVVLPESYILSKACDINSMIMEIECINKTLFLSKTGQGIQSGIKSAQIATIEAFAFSTGSPINVDIPHKSTTELALLLYNGIRAMDSRDIQSFFLKRKPINWKRYPWKLASIISTVVLSSYLILSSAWLLYQDSHIERKLLSQADQVSQVLSLQKQYNQEKKWHTTLTQPLSNQVAYWNAWPIILEIISVGVEISSIIYENDTIIVRGDTNESVKATDVLERLSHTPNVASASFKSPVSRSRNKERFTISFSLTNPKTLSSSKENHNLEVTNATTK